MHASAWSPLWWLDDGSAFLATLHHETAQAWTSAMAVARSRAEGAMTAWSEMELQYGSYVPAAAASARGRWSAQLAAATTPAAIDALATTLDRREVAVARKAATLDEVTVATGGVRWRQRRSLAAAEHAVSVARGDNLDTGRCRR